MDADAQRRGRALGLEIEAERRPLHDRVRRHDRREIPNEESAARLCAVGADVDARAAAEARACVRAVADEALAIGPVRDEARIDARPVEIRPPDAVVVLVYPIDVIVVDRQPRQLAVLAARGAA